MKLRWMILLLMIAGPAAAWSKDWVLGDVGIVEDYTAFDPAQGILVTLTNKSYYVANSPVETVCTQRFRVVVGVDGITTDLAKNIYALLLTARASGQRVRLLADPDQSYGGGYCAVQIASIGDF